MSAQSHEVREREREKSPEEDFTSLPGPPPFITEHEGKIWELNIAGGQQPIRARACGFGDKDRRPISPPPCVRLIIRDARTRIEIDLSKLDLSYFVLTVDLWDMNYRKEANLVKHQSASPAISTVSTAAYPRTQINSPFPAPQPYGGPSDPAYSGTGYNGSPATPTSAHSYDGRRQQSFSSVQSNGHGPARFSPAPQYSQDYRYGPPHHTPTTNGYGRELPSPNPYNNQQDNYLGSPYPQASPQNFTPQPSGLYTRNLIGNLSASAFRLKDLELKDGIWFVLQDLSVRTEGWFRLKFSFVNLQRSDYNSSPNDGDSPLIASGASAPVLASVFSQPFHVFSAKKFPGVIESTPLSRHFAGQGIKIPIRKEGKDGDKKKRKRGTRHGEEDEDEGEDEDDD